MDEDKALIDFYGGPTNVARMLGYDTKKGGVQRVQNWTSRGIPSDVKLKHLDLFGPDAVKAMKECAKDRRKPSTPIPLGKKRRSTDCRAEHLQPARKTA